MEKQKTLGVTEARFGLTLLICGLVAIGYIVLLRLGGTSQASVEHRNDIDPSPRIARVQPEEEQPTVLPLTPEDATPPRPERSAAPHARRRQNLSGSATPLERVKRRCSGRCPGQRPSSSQNSGPLLPGAQHKNLKYALPNDARRASRNGRQALRHRRCPPRQPGAAAAVAG